VITGSLSAWRSQARAWSPSSAIVWIAWAVIVALFLMALAAPIIAPHGPNAIELGNSLAPPSADHLLGTDSTGRDICSRLIYGARASLFGPLIVVAVSTVVGVPLGLEAGYRRGVVDSALSRTWDVMFAFPSLLLAIVIVATFGAGFWTATIAITIVYVPVIARVTRGAVLVERDKAYVELCRIQGFADRRTMWRHVLPNCSSTISSQATLNYGYALLDLAGLAFLGLGVRPPTADWGVMLAAGRTDLLLGSYGAVVSASVAIALTVVAFNIVGDALAEKAVGGR
jgi:peptide/nickel transport system permease protein